MPFDTSSLEVVYNSGLALEAANNVTRWFTPTPPEDGAKGASRGMRPPERQRPGSPLRGRQAVQRLHTSMRYYQ